MLLIQRANIATTIYETVPLAQPEAEAWPVNDHPVGIQADGMFARQLDTGFGGKSRNLLHDQSTKRSMRAAVCSACAPSAAARTVRSAQSGRQSKLISQSQGGRSCVNLPLP